MRLIDKAILARNDDERTIINNCCPITLFGAEAVDRHFDVHNCGSADCESCWEQQWRE